VLQQVSGVIAAHADLNGVLESLARFLPSVVSFEFLGVALHNPERRVFRLYAFGGTLAGSPSIETEIPEADPATTARLLDDLKPILLNDIEKETPICRYRRAGAAIRRALAVPPPANLATTAARRTGFWDHSAEEL
jgi:hypothetical protein